MNSHDITLKRERLNDAVFAATNLEHKRFLIERELVQLKWYGYRFLTPLAATKLFYDTYNEHLINYLRVNKDILLRPSLGMTSPRTCHALRGPGGRASAQTNTVFRITFILNSAWCSGRPGLGAVDAAHPRSTSWATPKGPRWLGTSISRSS